MYAISDVRLRVRAEYCNYETVLQGNVSSMKADPVERQLECFTQASAILRTRDLGFIVCDIKFSEITYLDAFWRDYLNGSLLEALKGKIDFFFLCFFNLNLSNASKKRYQTTLHFVAMLVS